MPMPSAKLRRDVSLAWPVCGSCGHRHNPVNAACVGGGIWLVLSICRDCLPRRGIYCHAHRA